ncbi:carboxypeptidase-like regulatory domain-containing protein [Lentzea sp. BCCO 10_0061]|uniref:Carboxypeptidase-like regulatory domain-containing protein n=1 Tax=Lentzea sokolovensis TaxID=3095429 RepID=A0ABU4UWT6_9PSEU|nr:carboxypeptidase-like regulatory domain-containing protein [Lentzea sp. BCCO 10_0061]MDX8143924.1 carboxypeptidase-like regulatory domain-containing protein [Lentzea sp. BCCO 10_0061]
MTTAVLLAFGTATSGAQAQEPEAPTSAVEPTQTTEPSTPPSTPPPASSDPSVPPPSGDPAPPSTSTPPQENPPGDTPVPSTPVTPTSEPAKAEEPKQATQQQAAPDLKISVKFDRAEYSMGEPLGVTLTVRNEGDVAANQVRFASEVLSLNLTTGVDDLVSRPSLAPGEVKVIKLGATAQWGVPSVALTVRTWAEGVTDKTPNDNLSRAETKIVNNGGQVSGVLFEDRDGNGVASPGEGIDWQTLRLSGGPAFPNSTQTYNGGQFTMRDVPPGTYQVRWTGSSGAGGDSLTVKAGQFITVKQGETTQVSLQAVPTLSRSLWIAGHSFDKPSYAKGDPISVSVILRNNGKEPITNLVTVCDPENDPATLDGTADGWGDLRPDRGGVTIGVGETKTFTVTDTVPDVDFPTGKVYFACTFSVDGRNADGPGAGYGSANPGLTVGADIAGIHGTVSGRLLAAGSGIPITSTKIVAINPANNRIIGQASTDWNGAWRIQKLPRGKVALQVVGGWKLEDGSAHRLVDVIAEQEVVADLDVVNGPFVKDPTVFAPDLKVSVSFDKQSYDISDLVRMTIKVENIGTGVDPGRGSWHGTPYNEQEPYFDYAELRRFLDPQIVLYPGESKQATFTGRIRDGGIDPEKLRKVSYVAEAGTQSDDPNRDNNKAEARADVNWGTGSVLVVVYGDRNLNGQPDAGEELANRKVRVGGGKPHVNREATTDASGRVHLTDLPAGTYSASDEYDRESGWLQDTPEADRVAVVNPGDVGTARVRLVRPLSDELKASIKFDKPEYQAGDAVGVTVSITNGTTKSLQVKAECGGGSYGPYLGNDLPEWGQLGRAAAGVQIAAGQTFEVRFSTALPASSPDWGYVTVGCSFGPENGSGNPHASATSKVPGATETFTGFVVTGDWMAPERVPNVKLVLLDPHTRKPVASTTTDAQGAWTFPDLPVGEYVPLVVGPWKVVDLGEGEPFGNVRGREWPSYVWVERGPEVADPTVATPGGAGGNGGAILAPATRNTDALANTGVGVLGLVLFGALLVMTGVAMRRKIA